MLTNGVQDASLAIDQANARSAVKTNDKTQALDRTEAVAQQHSGVNRGSGDYLKAAVTQLNDYVQSISRTVSFSIDEDSGKTVVKVYDGETEELIRQMPGDETLKLAASLQKGDDSGLIFDANA
jgi:flagellar protein FlaG